jgi:hypothetical protein
MPADSTPPGSFTPPVESWNRHIEIALSLREISGFKYFACEALMDIHLF